MVHSARHIDLENVRDELLKRGVLQESRAGGSLELRYQPLCGQIALMREVCSLLLQLCHKQIMKHSPHWVICTKEPHDQVLALMFAELLTGYYINASIDLDALPEVGVAFADMDTPVEIDSRFGCAVWEREKPRRDVLIVCGAPVSGNHLKSMVTKLKRENVAGVVALVAPQGITARQLGVPFFDALVRYSRPPSSY